MTFQFIFQRWVESGMFVHARRGRVHDQIQQFHREKSSARVRIHGESLHDRWKIKNFEAYDFAVQHAPF